MDRDFRTELLQLIEAFLAGRIDFLAFQKAYSRIFIDEIPEGVLPSNELSFFGDIHEKAEWTTSNPPQQDRTNGWIDERQFREWLRTTVGTE
jgi:hypothetical protein